MADIKNISEKSSYDYWYNLMPIKRRERIDAYKPQNSKLLSLAAGILIKKALENEGITEYEISENSMGKPYLVTSDKVFFNLSHSGEKAILAISDDEVGIDIEKDKTFNQKLTEFVFDDNEIQQAMATSQDTDCLFTALWTAKESIMKFYGKGISMEPKKIHLAMDFEGGFTIRNIEGDYDYSKLVLARKNIDDYQITICSKGDTFGNVKITDVFDAIGR